jgi:hypothetical protein
MKTTKHRPAEAPAQCDHCSVVTYEDIHDSQEVIVPEGFVLCHACWLDLEKHLSIYNSPELADAHEHNTKEWKRSYPQFMQIAAKWIRAKKRLPQKKRFHRSVPKWMRLAINVGKVTPGDSDIYIVTTCSDEVIEVERIDSGRNY